MINVNQVTRNKVQEWIGKNIDKKTFELRKEYIEGDHWRKGEGWVGPMPSKDEGKVYNDVMTRIERQFVSQNVCLEINSRHVDATVGRSPLWEFASEQAIVQAESRAEREYQQEQDRQNARQDARMIDWYDGKGIHSTLYDAVFMAKYGTSSLLRFVIPPSILLSGWNYTDENGDSHFLSVDQEEEVAMLREQGIELTESNYIDKLTYEEALNELHLEVVEPTKGTVYVDPDTLKEYGCYSVSKDDGENYAELSYIDEDGLTVLMVLGDKSGTGEGVRFDLGGQLWHHEIETPSLLSEQVIQQQNLLNKARTMLSANLDWSAFIERIFLNARKPGKEVKDASSPTGKRFVEQPYETGTGTTNFVVGLKFVDREGNEQMTTPKVVFRDPLNVDVFRDSADEAYEAMLQESRQMHALISGDAAASGESRIQAMSDFMMSLYPTKIEADKAGRWVLKTAHMIASALSNESVNDDLRTRFECRLFPGTLPAELQAFYAGLVDKGQMQLTTMLALIGIDDVDAEVAALMNSPESRMRLLKQQFELLTTIESYGLELQVAAKIVGMDESTVKMIESASPRVVPEL